MSFAILIGTIIGAIAAYAGGAVDNILMRLMDVLMAFPSLLLAIAIVSVLGTGLINALLAIGIVSIPRFARLVRSTVLSVKELEFVQASKALGGSPHPHPFYQNSAKCHHPFDRSGNPWDCDCNFGCRRPILSRFGC